MSDGELLDPADTLAAEYVLGVLSAEERRAIDARSARDAGLAAEIARWEHMLAPLALLVPQVEPPPELWMRLRRAVGGTPRPVRSGAARAWNTDQAVRFWRGATLGALALAACLGVVAVLPSGNARPASLAALAPLTASAPVFIVRVSANGGFVVTPLTAAAVPPGRDLELWALPQGAAKPISLGVLTRGGITVATSTLTAPGGKLLVSLEPRGGSPTGQPTGPVLYGGVITQL